MLGLVVLLQLLLLANAWMSSSNFALRTKKKVQLTSLNKLNPMRRFQPLHVASSTAPTEVAAETFEFESNVSRVMDIIIHSLYSNKDVFLRELISNAADACDKKRFMSLAEGKPSPNLRIRVYPNRQENTLTIEDTGIGMNKEDMIQNLGRIAESGTKKFMEAMGKNKEDLSLIGQFGVGFYSGFLVADKMTVVSKGNKGEQYRWEASADSLNQYSISLDATEAMEDTGTRITLHLKDESDQYLDDLALQSLIEKYSEFIPVPIELQRNVSRPESVPDPSQPVGQDGSIPMKTVMKRVLEWQVVNNKKPLWLRPVKDCTESDYDEFYRQTFKAYDKPLAHSHFSVEGNVDFKALLFLPTEVPYELTRDMFSAAARSMRLYVKRVFINDKFEDLLPRWLLFLRGVVDSDDLPLNVGREILQQSRTLRIIRQRLQKKAIDMIADIAARNETEYAGFWKNFGKYVKVGIIEDERSRDDLVPLCRFFTSKSNDSMSSLPDYVKRMPEDQKFIYYVVGETRAQAAMSPALEKLKKKGYEVILVSEPIDEMTLQNIEKYTDKTITDAGKEFNQDLSDEEKSEVTRKNDELEEFRVWMKDILGDKITRVEVSSRLVDSPATIVQSEYGVSPNMQKYLRAQAVVEGDNKGQFSTIFNQAVLEINPDHPIIIHLKAVYDTNKEDSEAQETVNLVFSTAALAAGYVLENSADYSASVTKLLTKLVTSASK